MTAREGVDPAPRRFAERSPGASTGSTDSSPALIVAPTCLECGGNHWWSISGNSGLKALGAAVDRQNK